MRNIIVIIKIKIIIIIGVHGQNMFIQSTCEYKVDTTCIIPLKQNKLLMNDIKGALVNYIIIPYALCYLLPADI